MSQDRIANVTGGSGGIGSSVAKRLAADGFIVAVQYRSAKDGAEAVVADIEAKGGSAFSKRTDLTDKSDILELFDTAEAKGEIAVVVQAAGSWG